MRELCEYLNKHKNWSVKTFGEGKFTLGLIKHIKKELDEILADPLDTREWIDVIILALDGYWRHGGAIELIMQDLCKKQEINFLRKYPKPTSEDEPTEHIYDNTIYNEFPSSTDIINAAKKRYEELGTKPEWRTWFRGFLEGYIGALNFKDNVTKAWESQDIEHYPNMIWVFKGFDTKSGKETFIATREDCYPGSNCYAILPNIENTESIPDKLWVMDGDSVWLTSKEGSVEYRRVDDPRVTYSEIGGFQQFPSYSSCCPVAQLKCRTGHKSEKNEEIDYTDIKRDSKVMENLKKNSYEHEKLLRGIYEEGIIEIVGILNVMKINTRLSPPDIDMIKKNMNAAGNICNTLLDRTDELK